MKTIGIVIPYFGKLPPFFQLWLQTAKSNSSIDFHIFTDDDSVFSDENIYVHRMTWSDMQKLASKPFDFNIALAQPYKLCDFKPAFGLIFSEHLKKYDFWGYCDVSDLLLGDLRSFFTEDVLDRYERCQYLGHISLYRNNERMNTLFMSQGKYPDLNYQDVFTTNDSCYFDEYRGMYAKCLVNDVKTFVETRWRDPQVNKDEFYDSRGRKFVVRWRGGHLMACYEDSEVEIMYAHFFRRKFEIETVPQHLESIKVTPRLVSFNSDVCESDFDRPEPLFRIKYELSKIKKNKYDLIKTVERQKWTRESDRYNNLLAEQYRKLNCE